MGTEIEELLEDWYGDEDALKASDLLGKKITEAEFINDQIYLTLEDGLKIVIQDQGQSCCEKRYMTCDDNIQDLVGHFLLDIHVKNTTSNPKEYGEHEIAFLEINTDKNFITVATHNEHNGWYGGFSPQIKKVTEK